MQVTTSFLLPLSTSLPHSLRCRRLEVVSLCTDVPPPSEKIGRFFVRKRGRLYTGQEVVGTRKNGRARRRHATPLACLRRARLFSHSPTTSKRLLRSLPPTEMFLGLRGAFLRHQLSFSKFNHLDILLMRLWLLARRRVSCEKEFFGERTSFYNDL